MKSFFIAGSLRLAALACAGQMLLTSPAYAADCHPTFGDDALDWVTNRISKQSQDLADADYAARTLNFQLVGLQDVVNRLNAESLDLEAVSTEISRIDVPTGTELAIAIRREQAVPELTAALYRIRADIEETRHRIQQLSSLPSREYFEREGLSNVGRATLLSSFQELGNAAESSLGGKYQVYVHVSFDENGNYKSSDLNGDAGIVDTVGLALLDYPPPADYIGAGLIAASAIYQAILIGDCQASYSEQVATLSRANEQVPSKLIAPAEQWKIYSDYSSTRLQEFAGFYPSANASVDALEVRWRELFAANAARAAANQTLLTDVKVTAIRQDYLNGDVERVFENIALSNVADGAKALNAYVVDVSSNVKGACLNAAGLVAEENALEGLDYAGAQISEFRHHPSFSPLYDLFDLGLRLTAKAKARTSAAGPTLTQRGCATQGLAVSRASALFATPKAKAMRGGKPRQRPTPTPMFAQKTSALTLSQNDRSMPAGRQMVRSSALVDSAGPDMSACVIFSTNGSYACSTSGSADSSYFDRFSHFTGNPESDVLWGANDGGLGKDGRRMNAEVKAASSNVELRVNDLRQLVAGVSAAGVQWRTENAKAETALAFGVKSSTASDAARDVMFVQSNSSLIGSAKARIDQFLTSPQDVRSSMALIATLGGGDLSLASFPADKVVPEVPVIPGITTTDRVYSSAADMLANRIARERLKDQQRLSGKSLSLAGQITDQADTLRRNGAPLLASRLVIDAASIRFAALGQLPNPTTTVVNQDGSLGQASITVDGTVPANSLLQISRDFLAMDTAFAARASALRGQISAGSDRIQRADALSEAQRLEASAKTSFFSGNVHSGAVAQKLALGVLDFASRFVPGVNWGRDAYEAISGRDAFSGEVLSTASRAIAVLGVVTLGVGSELSEAVHVADELKVIESLEELGGLGRQRAKEILEAAENSRFSDLKPSKHVFEEMAEDAHGEISMSEIKDAINNGDKWYNSFEQTVVAIEKDAAPGEVRVAACVDIDSKIITTVYREAKTDAELLISTIGGKGRYIPLSKVVKP